MASSINVPFQEELKKNPELKESDIQSLREWCTKQPHLPKMNDSELALFLHSNYYRLEPTKSTIDTFYSVRTHVPEFFANRDIKTNKCLQKISDVLFVVTLKNTTREGYKVIYSGLLDPDPSKYNYNDGMALYNMIMDIWLYSEGTTKGHVMVVDASNLALGHAARLNPMGLKKFMYYLQDGLPVRLKGLHFININPVMDIVFNMLKPFMKKELLEMLYMHSTMESLDKLIPIDIFPSDKGGKDATVRDLQNEQMKLLKQHREWFLEEETRARVDESKRPGKGKSATDLFGIEGSFKKLDID